MQDAQLAFLATERDDLVESEQNCRNAEIVRKIRVLDEPDGAMQQNDDVHCVEQLMGRPEGREDVSASRRRREDVYDADDDYQQHARETCAHIIYILKLVAAMFDRHADVL